MLRAICAHDIAHGDMRKSFLHRPHFRPITKAIGKRLLEHGDCGFIDRLIDQMFPLREVASIEEFKASIDRMHLNCVWDGLGYGY